MNVPTATMIVEKCCPISYTNYNYVVISDVAGGSESLKTAPLSSYGCYVLNRISES